MNKDVQEKDNGVALKIHLKEYDFWVLAKIIDVFDDGRMQIDMIYDRNEAKQKKLKPDVIEKEVGEFIIESLKEALK